MKNEPEGCLVNHKTEIPHIKKNQKNGDYFPCFLSVLVKYKHLSGFTEDNNKHWKIIFFQEIAIILKVLIFSDSQQFNNLRKKYPSIGKGVHRYDRADFPGLLEKRNFNGFFPSFRTQEKQQSV